MGCCIRVPTKQNRGSGENKSAAPQNTTTIGPGARSGSTHATWVRRERGRPETERMRNEGDDDRTSGQVLGEQRWTVRGRIVGMRGSRIAKLLVVAPSHWRLHLFIRAWINFLNSAAAWSASSTAAKPWTFERRLEDTTLPGSAPPHSIPLFGKSSRTATGRGIACQRDWPSSFCRWLCPRLSARRPAQRAGR